MRRLRAPADWLVDAGMELGSPLYPVWRSLGHGDGLQNQRGPAGGVCCPARFSFAFFSLPRGKRERWFGIYLRNLVIAGAVSLIVFRIFQPYAFSAGRVSLG